MTTTMMLPVTEQLDLLSRAVEEFVRGEGCRTGHLLKAGQLLQDWLQSECSRGERRAAVLKQAAQKIRDAAGIRVDPHTLVQAHHVRMLLAEEMDTTTLPYSGFKTLLPLVQRTDPSDPDCNTWHVTPWVDADKARALLTRWATTMPRMTVRQLKAEVDGLVGKNAPADEVGEDKTTVPREENSATADNYKPRIVAEEIADLIRNYDDQHALVYDLFAALKDIFTPALAEAVAAGLGNGELELCLARLRDACSAELGKLMASRRQTA